MYVHWWCDSMNNHTCHRNEQGLSADQSFIARVIFYDDGWYYTLRNHDSNFGPFASLGLAKQAVEKAVGGTQIPV